jgi:hypothetical protein
LYFFGFLEFPPLATATGCWGHKLGILPSNKVCSCKNKEPVHQVVEFANYEFWTPLLFTAFVSNINDSQYLVQLNSMTPIYFTSTLAKNEGNEVQ